MPKKPASQQQQFKAWLTQQTPQTLVTLLLDAAQRDERLAQTLWVKSTPAHAQDSLVDDLRLVINDVTTVDGFVDWRAMHRFVEPLDRAVDTLETLLTSEHAAALVELAQYAIEQTEKVLEDVDDSNGQVGDVLCRLGDLHLKACKLARPNPEKLATELFRLETTLPFGVCSFSAQTYRDVLGQAGLQAYRALAQAQWDALPAAAAQGDYDHDRYKITRVMKDLAQASGNVDEWVAIKARDLSYACDYLVIANKLTEAKRPDEAMQWAERGLRAHPERTDYRLRDFLVARYLKAKRHDEALQLTWLAFAEQPNLAPYIKLHGVAQRLGVWPQQRARALDWLQQDIERAAQQTSRYQPQPRGPDLSRRVAIALWEADLDAAWDAMHQGVCDQSYRLSLAQALEPTRAREAIVLYRQIIPEWVALTGNDAYASAVDWLRRVKQLMSQLDESESFATYVAELRSSFKAKRNFIKLLNAAKL
jgi:tetratricopeptide (TPR) repeat protein